MTTTGFNPGAAEARAVIEGMGVLPLGDGAASQLAVDRLLAAAGVPTDPGERGRDYVFNRGLLEAGWRWIDVAAASAGDAQTVMRAFAVAFFWNESMLPDMLPQTADQVAVGLGPVPSDVRRSLLGQVRPCVARADPHTVVFGDASGVWTAELVAGWAEAAPQIGW